MSAPFKGEGLQLNPIAHLVGQDDRRKQRSKRKRKEENRFIENRKKADDQRTANLIAKAKADSLTGTTVAPERQSLLAQSVQTTKKKLGGTA